MPTVHANANSSARAASVAASPRGESGEALAHRLLPGPNLGSRASCTTSACAIIGKLCHRTTCEKKGVGEGGQVDARQMTQRLEVCPVHQTQDGRERHWFLRPTELAQLHEKRGHLPKAPLFTTENTFFCTNAVDSQHGLYYELDWRGHCEQSLELAKADGAEWGSDAPWGWTIPWTEPGPRARWPCGHKCDTPSTHNRGLITVRCVVVTSAAAVDEASAASASSAVAIAPLVPKSSVASG
ncbi:hypothetical protein EDB84DRAFT_1445438 [Lactarius hengduanensis]|nr:hypothetical protein EDB84DRAFT_1445438 [Lactarius hengduanensis]